MVGAFEDPKLSKFPLYFSLKQSHDIEIQN